MPIKPEHRHRYPADWDTISLEAKERAGWKCQHEGCAARQYAVGHWSMLAGKWVWFQLDEPLENYEQARTRAAERHFQLHGDGPTPKGEEPIIVIVLTTMHLDHDPANCDPANLRPACQRHHLAHDQQHHNESAYMTRMAKRGNLELPL